MPTKPQPLSYPRRARPVLSTLARAALLVAAPACATVTTVRLQPDAIAVGPGLLLIPLPGGVKLDRVVKKMLVATPLETGRFERSPNDRSLTTETGRQPRTFT